MLRPCDVCGKADEQPRHISAVLNGTSLDTIRHFACCAAAGCPDGSCNKIMAEATGGSA